VAGLVVAQALLLSWVVAGVAMAGWGWDRVDTACGALLCVVLGRAVLSWAQDRFAHRAAVRVIADLRLRLLTHVAALGPTGLDGVPTASLTTLATRGLDALDGYLVRYLPQLLLAATVTPGLLAVVLVQDPVSAVTVAITLPLVPLFMVLVGMSTRSLAERRLRSMRRLGAQVLDLVAGLPTLRALGRDRGQAVRVREVGNAYRRATMGTLRAAFLSALVLETLTTLSVALVAVGIGIRLLHGDLDLRTGLAVLVLAPEIYLPLRMVGLHYHASVDGLAAAGEAFAVLDRAPPPTGGLPAPDLRRYRVVLTDVGVRHPGRATDTPHRLSLEVRPGRVLALVGPSGAGKSTAVQVLLGLRRPDTGRVLLRPDSAASPEPGQSCPLDVSGSETAGPTTVTLDLADVDPTSWWRQVAWVPQRPTLVPGSLLDNVRLTVTDAAPDRVTEAARRTGLAEVVAALPQGWDTPVGTGGTGLSAGQRQRLALTRALLDPAPLVVLDEPTAHLDAATEEYVHDAIRWVRDQGRAVVVVAHRPTLRAIADDVVPVTGKAPEPAGAASPGQADR
jgi:ATP-binding cassette subfamily C protein CydD